MIKTECIYTQQDKILFLIAWTLHYQRVPIFGAIKADAKSVREIVRQKQVQIDVFQREYMLAAKADRRFARRPYNKIFVKVQTACMKERRSRTIQPIIWVLLL